MTSILFVTLATIWEAKGDMVLAIQLDNRDNVAVVMDTLYKGDMADIGGIQLRAVTDIPRYHKIALSDIKEGEVVCKYGQPIGYATKRICKGEHVHIQNLDAQKMMQ